MPTSYFHQKTSGPQPRRLAYRLFLRESFRTIRVTASVFPSSRFLTTAMLDQVDFRKARTLVELGSGTGVITHEILRRMTPDSRLFALEINRNFVRHLRTSCNDRRLTVLHADASDLLNQLRAHEAGAVHAVISSLGLTGMSQEQRTRIVVEAEACLAPAGILTQFQYLSLLPPVPDMPKLQIHPFREKQFLRAYFPNVSAKRVLLNFPPAVVFTCRK
jgi:phosphatidylethanolamine/phosphatidyl-N-methylethanolamine N-methyltransferase